jgi:O-antigen/teichoic acid export membrane protein
MFERFRRLFQRKFVRDTLILQVSKLSITALGMMSWAIVPMALGPQDYGIWGLAQSFLSLVLILDLTSLVTSTSTLLGAAIGAKDEPQILDLLSLFLKVQWLKGLVFIGLMFIIGPVVAGMLYQQALPFSMALSLDYAALSGITQTGNPQIGLLAALLALTMLFDPAYEGVRLALQARRSMRQMAILQNLNQLVLTLSMVIAVLIRPEPLTLVYSRIAYAALMAVIAVLMYQRVRVDGAVDYPPLGAILRRAVTVRYSHWRFGMALALDKNISNLYPHLPFQFVGIFAGEAAAGYLQLAHKGILQAGIFTSAIFENMQAAIPLWVGQGDYQRLSQNFMRVVGVLTLGSFIFYGGLALTAPLLLPPLFGEQWTPVLPVLSALVVYGIITTIGGVFGPLYRAFNLMRAMIIIKLFALGVMILTGFWLVPQWGALGGAWMMNIVFLLSVGLTMIVVLRQLRYYVRHQS